MAFKFKVTPSCESLTHTVEETHSEWHEKIYAKVHGTDQTIKAGISYDYVSIPGLIKALQELEWVLNNLENLIKTVAESDDLLVHFKNKDGTYSDWTKKKAPGVSKQEIIKWVLSKRVSVAFIDIASKTDFRVDIGFEACNHTFTCMFNNRKLMEVDGSD